MIHLVFQLVFAAIFFSAVVGKYASFSAANAESSRIMQESPVCRWGSGGICCQSWFCFSAMMGLLMDKTDVCSFWPGCIVSGFFPCCTLWWLRSSSDVRTKLGGEKE